MVSSSFLLRAHREELGPNGCLRGGLLHNLHLRGGLKVRVGHARFGLLHHREHI